MIKKLRKPTMVAKSLLNPALAERVNALHGI